MKCEWVRENIVLSVYGELADDARYELESHTQRCAPCAAELKSARDFHDSLLPFDRIEPSPSLLAASRMRLQEGLETARQGGWWQRLIFEPSLWLQQIRFSPALTAAIFVAGFTGGIGAYRQIATGFHNGSASEQAVSSSPASPVESSITGIRSISQDPRSNRISIKYDTVSPQEAQGSLNDQRIQQLLLFAARNNYNSGVRMDSVDLLTQRPNEVNVREALIYALRYDSNPGVRLKSIDSLGVYVKDDTRVRDAVLEALQSDSNPGVRTEALRLVEPVRADSSVRAVLQRLAHGDKNQYIRSQARTLVAQLPQID